MKTYPFDGENKPLAAVLRAMSTADFARHVKDWYVDQSEKFVDAWAANDYAAAKLAWQRLHCMTDEVVRRLKEEWWRLDL